MNDEGLDFIVKEPCCVWRFVELVWVFVSKLVETGMFTFSCCDEQNT